jgi:glycerol kinase
MAKEYIISIDQGTTGSRVNVLNKDGDVIGSVYEEFTQHFPKAGWVEHDAMEIWEKVEILLSAACDKGGIDKKNINAIGITNQRETTVIWDKKTGLPAYRAIVWQCRRTSNLCNNLKEDGLSDKFRKKTGLVIDAYFSGTKIAWILDEIKDGHKRAQNGELLFGTIDSWLLYKLTDGEVHKTDYTNASRTLIYNIKEKKWDKELLDILKIPEPILPSVENSGSLFGETKNVKNFPDGVQICSIMGDQQSAVFGNLCFEPGESKNTYGTGCFLLMNIGNEFKLSKNGLLTTLACDIQGKPIYAFEGSIFIAGAVVQWLRDMVQFFPDAQESERLANSVKEEDEEGLVFIPAFAGMGAPYWDPDARGAILGITRGTDKAAITKAALKAIAFQTHDLVSAMQQDSNLKIDVLKVDGGATANNFLMQFQADILNIKIERPTNLETTALGAAFLAGLQCGFWKDKSELQKILRVDQIFSSQMNEQKRAKELNLWHDGVKRILQK